MNIDFSWGFYAPSGHLYKIEAGLNASFEYYKKLKNLLKIKKLKDNSLVRIGLGNKDGGYILANDFNEGGIAYSFGICNDVSWDMIMAELGYQIYMYDHTIQALPYTREEFHFFKEGISGKDEENEPLKTLKYYINKNNHAQKKNMILKMDVEGAEWDFLESVDLKTLQQFNQIVFEFHKIVQSGYSDKILKALEKLNKTHTLIHLHGNNSGYIIKTCNTIFPDVLEASYVLSSKYETEDCDVNLPTELDAPNDPGRPDVILGKWNEPLCE